MKKGLTEVVFILDESGSMYSLTADTIGGFNSLIAKQRAEEGEALISAVVFSDSSRVIYDRVPVSEIRDMTDKDYRPAGCTALLDAIGSAVKHIRTVHKYAREEDVPEHTLFVITTDGMENASRKFTAPEIKKMISGMQEKGWEFIFLGANIDAVETAESMGISADTAVNYKSDSVGTSLLYSCVSEAVSCARSGKRKSSKWRDRLDADMASRKN